MADSKAIAAQLEKLGVHGDNHLIHVNSTELQQIAQMLGRKPNINAKTGLMAFDDGGDSSDSSGSSDPGSDPGAGTSEPGSTTDTSSVDSQSMAGQAADMASVNDVSAEAAAMADTTDAMTGDMFGQMADLNAVNTISVTPQDLMNNPTVPDRSFMGQVANAIADPFGVTIGHDAFGNFSAEIDSNIAGAVAGMMGGPMAGFAVSTMADLAGISHATASFNSATGFNAGFSQPDQTNMTTAAAFADNHGIGANNNHGTSSAANGNANSGTSTAANGSAPGGPASGNGNDESGGGNSKVATQQTQQQKDQAAAQQSQVIAKFIQQSATQSALRPINPFQVASGKVNPTSILHLINATTI